MKIAGSRAGDSDQWGGLRKMAIGPGRGADQGCACAEGKLQNLLLFYSDRRPET